MEGCNNWLMKKRMDELVGGKQVKGKVIDRWGNEDWVGWMAR